MPQTDARQLHDRKVALARAARLLRHQDLVILDTETTGYGKNDEIIEICVIDLQGAVLFDTLLHPSRPIPERATAIHGITDEMTAGCPTFAEIAGDLLAILSLTPIRAIATYNAEFDRRMLLQTALTWQRPNQVGTHFTEWHCLMRLYSAYHGEWQQYFHNYKFQSLEQAAEHCGVALPEGLRPHRARADALLALGVLKAMAARAEQEGIEL